MYCKNCGNIMDGNDKFCKSCGAPVPQGQPQQNYGFQQNNYQQPQYNYQQPQYNYQQAQGYDYQQAHYANQAPGYQYARPGVTFGDAIRLYFSNYANFSGRARRSEYWYAYLFVWLVNFVVGLVLPFLSIIVALAFLVPNISMAVRRLHDTGKSGWNCLWPLLPLAGLVVLIIFLCADSEGPNQYGPSPKY